MRTQEVKRLAKMAWKNAMDRSGKARGFVGYGVWRSIVLAEVTNMVFLWGDECTVTVSEIGEIIIAVHDLLEADEKNW